MLYFPLLDRGVTKHAALLPGSRNHLIPFFDQMRTVRLNKGDNVIGKPRGGGDPGS